MKVSKNKTIHCIDHFGSYHDIPSEKFTYRASAYGVLKENDTFLMSRERWTKLWEFPGGGVKGGETIEEGLIREFDEETGFIVKVGKLITFQEDFFYAKDRDQAWHSLRFIYEVEKVRGVLKTNGNNDDIIGAAFVKRQDINRKTAKEPIVKLLAVL